MKFLSYLLHMILILHVYHHETRGIRKRHRTSRDWLNRITRTKYHKGGINNSNATKKHLLPQSTWSRAAKIGNNTKYKKLQVVNTNATKRQLLPNYLLDGESGYLESSLPGNIHITNGDPDGVFIPRLQPQKRIEETPIEEGGVGRTLVVPPRYSANLFEDQFINVPISTVQLPKISAQELRKTDALKEDDVINEFLKDQLRRKMQKGLADSEPLDQEIILPGGKKLKGEKSIKHLMELMKEDEAMSLEEENGDLLAEPDNTRLKMTTDVTLTKHVKGNGRLLMHKSKKKDKHETFNAVQKYFNYLRRVAKLKNEAEKDKELLHNSLSSVKHQLTGKAHEHKADSYFDLSDDNNFSKQQYTNLFGKYLENLELRQKILDLHNTKEVASKNDPELDDADLDLDERTSPLFPVKNLREENNDIPKKLMPENVGYRFRNENMVQDNQPSSISNAMMDDKILTTRVGGQNIGVERMDKEDKLLVGDVMNAHSQFKQLQNKLRDILIKQNDLTRHRGSNNSSKYQAEGRVMRNEKLVSEMVSDDMKSLSNDSNFDMLSINKLPAKNMSAPSNTTRKAEKDSHYVPLPFVKPASNDSNYNMPYENKSSDENIFTPTNMTNSVEKDSHYVPLPFAKPASNDSNYNMSYTKKSPDQNMFTPTNTTNKAEEDIHYPPFSFVKHVSNESNLNNSHTNIIQDKNMFTPTNMTNKVENDSHYVPIPFVKPASNDSNYNMSYTKKSPHQNMFTPTNTTNKAEEDIHYPPFSFVKHVSNESNLNNLHTNIIQDKNMVTPTNMTDKVEKDSHYVPIPFVKPASNDSNYNMSYTKKSPDENIFTPTNMTNKVEKVNHYVPIPFVKPASNDSNYNMSYTKKSQDQNMFTPSNTTNKAEEDHHYPQFSFVKPASNDSNFNISYTNIIPDKNMFTPTNMTNEAKKDSHYPPLSFPKTARNDSNSNISYTNRFPDKNMFTPTNMTNKAKKDSHYPPLPFVKTAIDDSNSNMLYTNRFSDKDMFASDNITNKTENDSHYFPLPFVEGIVNINSEIQELQNYVNDSERNVNRGGNVTALTVNVSNWASSDRKKLCQTNKLCVKIDKETGRKNSKVDSLKNTDDQESADLVRNKELKNIIDKENTTEHATLPYPINKATWNDETSTNKPDFTLAASSIPVNHSKSSSTGIKYMKNDNKSTNFSMQNRSDTHRNEKELKKVIHGTINHTKSKDENHVTKDGDIVRLIESLLQDITNGNISSDIGLTDFSMLSKFDEGSGIEKDAVLFVRKKPSYYKEANETLPGFEVLQNLTSVNASKSENVSCIILYEHQKRKQISNAEKHDTTPEQDTMSNFRSQFVYDMRQKATDDVKSEIRQEIEKILSSDGFSQSSPGDKTKSNFVDDILNTSKREGPAWKGLVCANNFSRINESASAHARYTIPDSDAYLTRIQLYTYNVSGRNQADISRNLKEYLHTTEASAVARDQDLKTNRGAVTPQQRNTNGTDDTLKVNIYLRKNYAAVNVSDLHDKGLLHEKGFPQPTVHKMKNKKRNNTTRRHKKRNTPHSDTKTWKNTEIQAFSHSMLHGNISHLNITPYKTVILRDQTYDNKPAENTTFRAYIGIRSGLVDASSSAATDSPSNRYANLVSNNLLSQNLTHTTSNKSAFHAGDEEVVMNKYNLSKSVEANTPHLGTKTQKKTEIQVFSNSMHHGNISRLNITPYKTVKNTTFGAYFDVRGGLEDASSSAVTDSPSNRYANLVSHDLLSQNFTQTTSNRSAFDAGDEEVVMNKYNLSKSVEANAHSQNTTIRHLIVKENHIGNEKQNSTNNGISGKANLVVSNDNKGTNNKSKTNSTSKGDDGDERIDDFYVTREDDGFENVEENKPKQNDVKIENVEENKLKQNDIKIDMIKDFYGKRNMKNSTSTYNEPDPINQDNFSPANKSIAEYLQLQFNQTFPNMITLNAGTNQTGSNSTFKRNLTTMKESKEMIVARKVKYLNETLQNELFHGNNIPGVNTSEDYDLKATEFTW